VNHGPGSEYQDQLSKGHEPADNPAAHYELGMDSDVVFGKEASVQKLVEGAGMVPVEGIHGHSAVHEVDYCASGV
jgi:hypothetical protein